MITGSIRNQIDRIWDAFWAGGISNPLEVIERITYLLFLRRLDELHTLEENKAARLKKTVERPVFPKGKDSRGRSCQDLRWSRFKHFASDEMYTVVSEHVFPFLRSLGGNGSTYSQHMKDARFTIPKSLLAKVVDLLDSVPREDRDTKGDPELMRSSAARPPLVAPLIGSTLSFSPSNAAPSEANSEIPSLRGWPFF